MSDLNFTFNLPAPWAPNMPPPDDGTARFAHPHYFSTIGFRAWKVGTFAFFGDGDLAGVANLCAPEPLYDGTAVALTSIAGQAPEDSGWTQYKRTFKSELNGVSSIEQAYKRGDEVTIQYIYFLRADEVSLVDHNPGNEFDPQRIVANYIGIYTDFVTNSTEIRELTPLYQSTLDDVQTSIRKASTHEN